MAPAKKIGECAVGKREGNQRGVVGEGDTWRTKENGKQIVPVCSKRLAR